MSIRGPLTKEKLTFLNCKTTSTAQFNCYPRTCKAHSLLQPNSSQGPSIGPQSPLANLHFARGTGAPRTNLRLARGSSAPRAGFCLA
jgi:hypothetical protein